MLHNYFKQRFADVLAWLGSVGLQRDRDRMTLPRSETTNYLCRRISD